MSFLKDNTANVCLFVLQMNVFLHEMALDPVGLTAAGFFMITKESVTTVGTEELLVDLSVLWDSSRMRFRSPSNLPFSIRRVLVDVVKIILLCFRFRSWEHLLLM